MPDEAILLMPFIDESESFANGFECGKIWEKLQQGECFDRHWISTSNIKQVKLMCETMNVEFDIDIANETWATLTLMPSMI